MAMLVCDEPPPKSVMSAPAAIPVALLDPQGVPLLAAPAKVLLLGVPAQHPAGLTC